MDYLRVQSKVISGNTSGNLTFSVISRCRTRVYSLRHVSQNLHLRLLPPPHEPQMAKVDSMGRHRCQLSIFHRLLLPHTQPVLANFTSLGPNYPQEGLMSARKHDPRRKLRAQYHVNRVRLDFEHLAHLPVEEIQIEKAGQGHHYSLTVPGLLVSMLPFPFATRAKRNSSSVASMIRMSSLPTLNRTLDYTCGSLRASCSRAIADSPQTR